MLFMQDVSSSIFPTLEIDNLFCMHGFTVNHHIPTVLHHFLLLPVCKLFLIQVCEQLFLIALKSDSMNSASYMKIKRLQMFA